MLHNMNMNTMNMNTMNGGYHNSSYHNNNNNYHNGDGPSLPATTMLWDNTGYETPPPTVDAPAVAPTATTTTATTNTSALTFPQKLHTMLCDAIPNQFDDICCWEMNGTAFRIKDTKRFVVEVMPLYFAQQTKYKSFQRMLNIYNFLRIPHGPYKGCYTHRYLRESEPDMAATIQRYNHRAWKKKQHDLKQQQQQQQQSGRGAPIVTPPVTKQLTSVSASAASLNENYQQQQHHHQSTSSFGNLLQSIDQWMMNGGVDNDNDGNNDAMHPHQQQQQQHHHTRVRTFSLDLFKDLDMDSILLDEGENGDNNNDGGNNNNEDINDLDVLNSDMFDLFQFQPSASSSPAEESEPESEPVYGSESSSSSSSTMDDELRQYEQQMDDRFFPIKLYDMLEASENDDNNGMKSIISWVHNGTAFKVHDAKAFTKHVMPLYFDQTQYESFRRQLNMYGFIRQPRGIHRGIYNHPCFQRGHREQCRNVVRRTPTTSSSSSTATSTTKK